MDKETQNILNKQARFDALVNSQGWSDAIEVKDELVKKLMDLRQMPNLPDNELLKEIELRRASIALLEDYISIIIGQSEMYKSNISLWKEQNDSKIIIQG
jgi:hypothetical protein